MVIGRENLAKYPGTWYENVVVPVMIPYSTIVVRRKMRGYDYESIVSFVCLFCTARLCLYNYIETNIVATTSIIKSPLNNDIALRYR